MVYLLYFNPYLDKKETRRMENLSKAHDWMIEGWLFLLSVLASFVLYIKHKDDRLLRDYQRKNDQEHSMLWNQKVSTELF